MNETLETIVDPSVSRAKFAREVAAYRAMEEVYIRQGWWMVKADYPEVLIVFGTAHLKPPLVAFGALLDFTNYDLWPPSVKLVNPFTQVPFKATELPTVLPRRQMARPLDNTTTNTPGSPASLVPSQAGQIILQPMIVHNPPDGEPFLCLPGTRAYHEHPSHSGDSWLLHRGRGEGTLSFILNTLYTYGVTPMMFHVHIQLAVNLERVPE